MSAWRLSLTFRLVSLFVVVIASLLVGLGWLTMAATNRHFLELDEIYLRDKGVLVREIGSHSDGMSEFVTRMREMLSTQTGLSIALYENSKPVYHSNQFSIPSDVQTALLNHQATGISQWQVGDQTLRGIAVALELPAELSEQSARSLVAILALNTEHHDHFMDSFRQLIWFYVALAICIGGLLAWWAARKGLAPLRPIIKIARQISANQLGDRISTEHMPLELRSLAETLNSMLARLEQDFLRLSDFSSDLAHELRTPISNMLVQTQVTLGKRRDVDQYQEALSSMVEELERLSHMVSDMLYLAKTEHQVEVPDLENIDLVSEARDLAEFYQLMADDKGVNIEVAGHGAIRGDRNMVRRAISNLVSNAIRHTLPGSPIGINIETSAGRSILSVSNQGDTIKPEDIDRIFDRFYRAEKARTHPGSDGTGLGLSITRAIMLAHAGQIKVTSNDGVTVFSLIFSGNEPDDISSGRAANLQGLD